MRRTLELKRVDLGSLFKVAFVLYAVLGLVAGLMAALVFMMMGSLSTLLSDEGFSGFGVFTGVAGLILVPMLSVMYGVIGSLVVTIIGLLYNLAAGRVGGVKFEFEPKDDAPPVTVTTATAPPMHI